MYNYDTIVYMHCGKTSVHMLLRICITGTSLFLNIIIMYSELFLIKL